MSTLSLNQWQAPKLNQPVPDLAGRASPRKPRWSLFAAWDMWDYRSPAPSPNRDFLVIGLDIDDDKVDKLNAGHSYIRHIPPATIQAMLKTGRFRASSDFSQIANADVVTICVPTPLNRYREPDLSYVTATARGDRSPLRGPASSSSSNRRPIPERRLRYWARSLPNAG